MKANYLFLRQALVFVGLISISYIVTLLFALFFKPAPLANVIGFLALVTYITTLLPSIIRIVYPTARGNKILGLLHKNRRCIGIITFILGLDHGLLMTIQKQLNWLAFHTYFNFFQGISMLIIFTALAITSNDWSVKILKSQWKKLHSITYLVIFLLPWHILDKMSTKWSYITPFAVLLSLLVGALFVRRKYLESGTS